MYLESIPCSVLILSGSNFSEQNNNKTILYYYENAMVNFTSKFFSKKIKIFRQNSRVSPPICVCIKNRRVHHHRSRMTCYKLCYNLLYRCRRRCKIVAKISS